MNRSRSTGRRRGVALLALVVIVGLLGIGSAVLMSGSNRLADETNVLLRDAWNRTLLASGEAWAREHAGEVREDKPLELQTEALGIPEGRMVLKRQDDTTLRLQASCAHRNRTHSMHRMCVPTRQGRFSDP